ncbi:acyltransferase [Mesorhizobium sp. 1M-11]|uniref:acyltransferase family protein n=1 Tax=Mesorhizobium sp. 1M-11 TaxID=1529006 RepID=UPI0006C76357|nr:acyltransferase [Mesorhizobium sp. 1M-11]
MQGKIRFQSIQALRGIAVLAVLIFHSHWIVSWKSDDILHVPLLSDYGYLGVNFFFCISGFVICHVVIRDANFSMKDFVVRRIAKIYPIYFLTNLTIIFIWFFTPIFDNEVSSLGFWGVMGSFLIFPMDQYPLLSPGWSLEHEVLFYLISGVFVTIASIRFLPVVLFLLFVAGMHLSGWDFHIFSRYQIYFATGILSYYLTRYRPRYLLISSAAAMSLAALIGSNVIATNMYVYDALLALGFMALISACVSLESAGFHFPALLVQVGEASYSLYIVHAVIFIFLSIVGYRLGVPVELWRWGGVAFTMLLSFVVYKRIEAPLHRAAFKVLMPAQSVVPSHVRP